MHKLIGIAFSHYVEKARWALDRFGVPYEYQRVLPFIHFAAVYRLHRGQYGRQDRASSRFSTPVLRTPEGRLLCDSAEIVRYASDRFAPAGQALYPTPEVAELEQHFHDDLGPHTRRAAYGVLLEQPALLQAMADHNVNSIQAGLFKLAFPFVKRGLKGSLGINEARVQRSVDKTLREFEAVSARLSDGRPFLLGDRFTAADLSFASLAAPALLPPEYGAWLPPLPEFGGDDFQPRVLALRETAAGAFAMRLYREERGRVLKRSHG